MAAAGGRRVRHDDGDADPTGARAGRRRASNPCRRRRYGRHQRREQTHDRVDGYGCGNTFRANDSHLGGADGYAINVTNQDACEDAPNIVTSDNTVTDAGSGLTNIDTTE